MVGIVLISHGDMSKGMLDSCGMFFSKTALAQVNAVSLLSEESPEDFDIKLDNAIKEVDSGDGVILLADLLGGTPCNRAAYKISDTIKMITGVNLPILVELLGLRESGNIDIDELVNIGQYGIVNYNKLLGEE